MKFINTNIFDDKRRGKYKRNACVLAVDPEAVGRCFERTRCADEDSFPWQADECDAHPDSVLHQTSL